MKKSILAAAILSLSLTVNAQPNNVQEDTCSKLPGHWTGFYTLKDQELCKQLNGCTHLVAAEVKQFGNNEYAILIQPAISKAGEMMISCSNGTITSAPERIKFSCSDNQCFVRYSDESMFSEMMKS